MWKWLFQLRAELFNPYSARLSLNTVSIALGVFAVGVNVGNEDTLFPEDLESTALMFDRVKANLRAFAAEVNGHDFAVPF